MQISSNEVQRKEKGFTEVENPFLQKMAVQAYEIPPAWCPDHKESAELPHSGPN